MGRMRKDIRSREFLDSIEKTLTFLLLAILICEALANSVLAINVFNLYNKIEYSDIVLLTVAIFISGLFCIINVASIIDCITAISDQVHKSRMTIELIVMILANIMLTFILLYFYNVILKGGTL